VSKHRRNGKGKPSRKMVWRRIDLHLHTPASKDYQDADATYLDILGKAEAEGLDIIAFTDHNTVAGYAAMLREISDLERWETAGHLAAEDKPRLTEYRRLRDKVLVLPGFEFTATLGFHILAIFDQDVTIRALEHVLLELRVPFGALDSGETEVGATSDALTAYRVMAQAGALVIAAHANSSHGIALVGVGFGGQTRIAYTQDANLHALEVTDLESKRRRRTASFFSGAKPEYPRRMHCIQGSDAHRITGIPGDRQKLGVGERVTEVLLPEVSFKALKEVFLSKDFSRTRPRRRTTEQPFDHVQAARREGVSIVRSFHEGMTRQGGRMHGILRDVVAFANTNGGTIYVGISGNRKVAPKGVDTPPEAISELRAEIRRLVTPPIDVDFSVLNTRGRNVVTIEVPKGSDPPYVLEGSKIYLRQEAETNLAMRDEIVQLIKQTVSASVAPATASGESVSRPSERAQSPEEGSSLIEPPHTGVEIVRSVQQNGVIHHTMRDLRQGREVHNVTHSSARKLWRYAIALKEKHTFQAAKVTWIGNLGLWHKYLRAGRPRYDLVQKAADGQVHIYYGVTDEGIHGPWKAVVGMED